MRHIFKIATAIELIGIAGAIDARVEALITELSLKVEKLKQGA